MGESGRHVASSGDASYSRKPMAYVDVGRGNRCGSDVKGSENMNETVGAA